jgi:hypothetical protein
VVIQPVGSSIPAVTMTMTDPATTHTGQAPTTTKLARPGLKPLLYWTGPDLQVAAVSFVLDGRGSSIEPTIAALQTLIQLEVVVANYGQLMTGIWWVTDCEFDTQRREPGTNNTTRAAVKITFTESNDNVASAPQATTVVSNP